MSQVGELNVDLTLTDNGFTVTTTKAGQVVRQFSQDLKALSDASDKSVGSHESLITSFRSLVVTMGAARFALMDINDIFLSLPKSILNTSAELERLTMLMQGLSNAATEAGKALEAQKGFNFIMQMAQTTPFNVKTLTDSFVKLKSGGIDPMNGSLQAITDSVAKFGGNSETMKSAVVAIQQMMGKGTVSMEELRRQLGQAIPDAMKMMAAGAGYTMDQFLKSVGKGAVAAPEALKRMLAVMEIENSGSAARMMQTWTGMSEQLQTRWHLLEKEAGSGFFDASKAAMKALSESLGSTDIQRDAYEFGQALASIVQGGTQFVKTLYEARDTIKLILEELAVVWAISKMQAWGAAFKASVIEPYNKLMANAVIARDAQLAEIETVAAAQAAAARQEVTLSQARVLRAQEESARLIAIKEQQFAEMAALEAAMTARGSVGPLLAGGVGAAGRLGAMKEEIAETERLTQIQQAEMAVAQSATAASAARAAKLMEVGVAAGAAAGSMGLLARAGTLLGMGVRALGGPLGIILTLLPIGITLWEKWGNSAKDAVDKVNAALGSGTSDRLTLKQNQDMLAAANAEAQRYRQQAEMARNPRDPNEKRAKEFDAMAADAESRAKSYSDRISQIYQQVAANEVSAGAKATQAVIDSIVKSEHDKMRVDESSINERFDEQEKGLAATDAKRAALEQQRMKSLNDRRAQEAQAIATQMKDLADKNKAALAEARQHAGAYGGQAIDDLQGQANAAMDAYNKYRDLAATAGTFNTPMAMQNAKPERMDPLSRSLAAAKRDMDAALNTLKAVGDGTTTFDELYSSALQKVEDMRKGGQFDHKSADGKTMVTPDKNDPMLQWEAFYIAVKEAAVTNTAAVKGANKDLEGSFVELKEAQQRMANPDNPEKVASGVQKMEQSVAKLRATMVDAREALAGKMIELQLDPKADPKKIEEVSTAMRALGQSLADFDQNSGQAIHNKALAGFDNWVADLSTKTQGNLAASIVNPMERAQAEFNAESKRMYDQFTVWAVNIMATADQTPQGLADAEGSIALGWQKMLDYMSSAQKKFFEEHKSGVQKMVDSWLDAKTQMDSAETKWMQNGINDFVTFATTGKKSFGDLALSIVQDILRIQLQMAFVKGGGANWVQSIGNSILSAIGGGGTSSDTTGAAAAINGGGLSTSANGNIITKHGPIPLRKYAMGGIASSPHVAIYGEGSSPEAYVPLPDGRTIPVTMQGGGGAPNVVVNVINQSGQDVNAEQKQPRFDGKQMVLDIVLSAMQRPGQFRDGMKGAVKT